METIHKYFKNLFRQRKEWLEAEERTKYAQRQPSTELSPRMYVKARLPHQRPVP